MNCEYTLFFVTVAPHMTGNRSRGRAEQRKSHMWEGEREREVERNLLQRCQEKKEESGSSFGKCFLR